MNGQDVHVQSDNRCFLPASGPEFRASCFLLCARQVHCSATDGFGCCAVSAPKSLSEGCRGVLSALSRKTCASLTDKTCVHLTQSPLISVACVSFSTGPILQLLSLPSLSHALGGWWQHWTCPTSQKVQRCTNMSISKSYTKQLDSADARKTFLLWLPKGSYSLPHRYHHSWFWCRHLSACTLWFTPFCRTPGGRDSWVVPRAGLCHQPPQSAGSTWHLGAEN